MIKLADGEESYNLIIDAGVGFYVFCDGFVDICRCFGWKKINQYNAKCGRNQDETQECQNHHSNDFPKLILLLDAWNGGNDCEKYERNYRDEEQIKENIANRFQINDKIRRENSHKTSDENPDEKQDDVAVVFPERWFHASILIKDNYFWTTKCRLA